MTKRETIKLLAVLNAAYPNFFKDMDKQQKMAQIELYQSRFKDTPVEIVAVALERYIDTNTYPPTIAGLKAIIADYQDGNKIDELWKEAWAAICGRCKFEKLSDSNKIFFGSQSAIDDIGLDTKTIQSVIKGQHLKRIKEILRIEESRKQAFDAIGENNFNKLIKPERSEIGKISQ